MRITCSLIVLGAVLGSRDVSAQSASSNGVVTLEAPPSSASRDGAPSDSTAPFSSVEPSEGAQASQTALPPPSATPPGPNHPAASRNNWWTPLASLSLVLVLIVVAARVFRRYVPSANPSLPSEALEVLGSSQMDPKLRLHVVRWGSRLLLLGSGPQGVQSLAELSEPAEVENLVKACRASRPRPLGRTLRQLCHPTQGLGLRGRLTVQGEGRP